jgi:hypothetical protein
MHGPWLSLSNGILTHLFGFDETMTTAFGSRMTPLPNRYMFRYFSIKRSAREWKIELSGD